MNYRYIGDGSGVPGLPHEITDEEATAQGLTELLQAAVQNGNYREVAGTLPDPALTSRSREREAGDAVSKPARHKE